MGKLIIITGTPGVGKSHLAALLVSRLGLVRLDLHHYYKKLSTKYNRANACYDLDYIKVKKFVHSFVIQQNKTMVLDSHVSHLLPVSFVKICIVLTCSDLKLLEKRLKARHYSKKKIEENLDVERLQVCLGEALDNQHRVITYDVTEKGFEQNIVRDIKRIIGTERSRRI